MPLARVQVRNEYGLGLPELYKVSGEDPKAVLDGVAVSGLVGILRQLGDLAEFAAEVFHGLQEQVMTTASRSHKLMVRVQHIETVLPPLEKAILAQRSYLHFAYTAGSHWHACVQNEQNHFIYNDLPRFVMDSYEECCDPPRLHLLDKFDTGGPGSCLKRYSDPTFVKWASANPNEAKAEKVSRDKKVRRSKKKRIWQRNGEVSHGASISNHSGRMQCATLNVDEQSSPSQTVSTLDVTLKSDLGDQSNSFDSRTESGYIECVFHPSYSMKPEEHEPQEFSSSTLKLQHNDNLDSAFVDEQSIVDDGSQCSLSQEHTGPSSSCVTWDEKMEIMEPKGQQYDYDKALESLSTNFDLDAQEKEVVNLRSIGQMDLQFDNANTPTSISGGNQLDDIENETNNYMDALNTIESESETDLDCQTKREVHQYSNFTDEGIEDGMLGLKAHHSIEHPSNSETQTAAHSYSNKETSWDEHNSASPESCSHEQSHQMAGKSSTLGNIPGIDFCGDADILDGSNTDSVISNKLYSDFGEPNSQAPTSDKILSSSCEPQKSPTELSGVHSVTFWTNGGLLGLQPSKPLDFNMLNSVRQDSLARSKDDTIGPSSSSHSNILKGDGHTGKPDMLTKFSESIEQDPSSKHSASCHHDQEDGLSIKKTSWRFSPDDLDVKLEKSGEASQENGENSSQMFGHSNGLLGNGLRREVSLVPDHKSDTAISAKTGVFEQKSKEQDVVCQTFSETTFKERFGTGPPVNSPSSSPPLEHMEISFQPINGYETSKLALKFPDRDQFHESSRDMFPSFQLVPEPAIPKHDISSDSDDDTFSRSSPYISDECLSHESNSEQWESSEIPRSKDHELYDALYEFASTEPVSSSLELKGTPQGSILVDCRLQVLYAENGVEASQSGPLLDLPSFYAVNPLFEQEIKNESDAKNLQESHNPKESPMILPPPLPPLQWRITKSHSDVAEDKHDAVSETQDHAFDIKILESTIPLQPKPNPFKQQHDIEAIALTLKSKQTDQQKLNGQKEANHSPNCKLMDEKEDFLHQIREKSCSLRRTVKAKPTFTPGPSTNVKVTAILEKANAIRQAVGSDDGEDDDRWSDT
ncbi:hypothetical protein F0562_013896 [Nyssa sinensis]|uniref:Protein SCAR n=1 Tax=Nyssa sinensis TaxID=561372 RepID=A0A5J4ZNW2_9ASTE|nr:hypothetical protein F0562_013896 [Nyssa sinensis]